MGLSHERVLTPPPPRAGLSTALGGLVVVALGRPSPHALGHMLSFSSGVMLFISFVDLMPEAMGQVGFGVANMAFFAGMGVFAVGECRVGPKIGWFAQPHLF